MYVTVEAKKPQCTTVCVCVCSVQATSLASVHRFSESAQHVQYVRYEQACTILSECLRLSASPAGTSFNWVLLACTT